MGYIANNTRATSLTIAGVEYLSNLISWQVSDASANKNGCISTAGTLVLGTKPGGVLIEDYDRNNFRRGDEVILKITIPGGAEVIHPRGRLYVVTTSYDVEQESLSIEIGCRLSLLALTEDTDDTRLAELQALVPISLDVAQESYSNCCASFASAGQYVYQDNSGDLITGTFFAGDNFETTAPGEWVSVLGTTATSVAPLAGTEAIPDQVRLSYQVPSDGLNEDNKGQVDTTTTQSYYFLQYPVVFYQRQNTDATPGNPNGTLDNVTNVTDAPPSTGTSSSCGNTPSAPDGADQPSACNEGYTMVQSPIYLPAYRVATQVTTYDAPGGQVSRVYQETRGPRIEANQQYYADSFAYCRQTWGTACNPNGNCPTDGMEESLLSYSETINYYGSANELVRTIQDVYATLLSGAQPSDWRAGNVSGQIQQFDPTLKTNYDMYRVSRTDTRYYQENNVNIQATDTYQSTTTRGVGIKGGQNIDALSGIKTSEIRKSATITALDIQPDIVNTSTTATTEKKTTLRLFTGRFVTPPTEAGPYIVDEQIPVALLFDNEAEIDSVVSAYSDYLTRFIKGDAFGLQVGEALRDEVVNNWYPGMPFRYYDPSKDRLMAMRMDATAWGVSTQEAAFVTNGIWNGFSDGDVTIPDNLVGNSLPDMGGGITPPTPIVPPSVDNEDSIDSGAFAWDVDVHIMTKVEALTFGNDGVVPPPPGDESVAANITTTCWVEGLIAESGSLLSVNTDGSIPLDYNGSLVTVDGVVLNGDLFS